MGTQTNAHVRVCTRAHTHTVQVSLILESTRLTPETLSVSAAVSLSHLPSIISSHDQWVPDGHSLICSATCWDEWGVLGWGCWGTHAYDITDGPVCLLQSQGASPGLEQPQPLMGGDKWKDYPVVLLSTTHTHTHRHTHALTLSSPPVFCAQLSWFPLLFL